METVLARIATITDPRIMLLRRPDVIRWLWGDCSFLPAIEEVRSKAKNCEKRKALEDEWGRTVTKLRRPDLALAGQWTNKFGEHLGEELMLLKGQEARKPVKRDHLCPDLETDAAIVEVKAETHFTTGTAGEKILGVPFKYAEVPRLYGKPLWILCLGGAEVSCRTQYGCLGSATDNKKKILDFYTGLGITYVGATDILKDWAQA
jgi:hypothetical protein